jgi:acetylornithine deacetylase/succinyl-diaminopimelate desuccinylase-like protein
LLALSAAASRTSASGQPAGDLSKWWGDPFECRLESDRLYGRGVSDNKAQVLLNLQALSSILAQGNGLPCNLKLVVEGNEEHDDSVLDAFVAAHRDLLRADLLVNCDRMMYGRDLPGITIGLRGFVALEVELRTSSKDLHSGLYGGATPNAIRALAALIQSFHGARGEVAVADFYSRVSSPSSSELRTWSTLNPLIANIFEDADVAAFAGEESYSVLERLWSRPTLEVTGITGGFQGEGTGAIVPGSASAKISCRLVPDQDPGEIVSLLRRHIALHTSASARAHIFGELIGTPGLLTDGQGRRRLRRSVRSSRYSSKSPRSGGRAGRFLCMTSSVGISASRASRSDSVFQTTASMARTRASTWRCIARAFGR